MIDSMKVVKIIREKDLTKFLPMGGHFTVIGSYEDGLDIEAGMTICYEPIDIKKGKLVFPPQRQIGEL